MRSKSQVGQDLWAYENCQLKTFLDVGASKPIKHNNTYMLECAGWEGVCVDCDKSHAEDYAKFRASPYYIVDARLLDWEMFFAIYYDGVEKIGYLSLDCDDDTLSVLKALPESVKFEAITVEHDSYRLGTGVRDEIRGILRERGYKPNRLR